MPNNTDRESHIVAITASNENSLHEIANWYAAAGVKSAWSFPEFAYSINKSIEPQQARMAVVASSADEFSQKVQRGEVLIDSNKGRPVRRKIAFLFSGDGCQYSGMGSALYRTQPIFRKRFNECASVFAQFGERYSLLDVLENKSDQLSDPVYGQSVLLALQLALYQTWRSFGVAPDLFIGYSVGEFAVAVATESLSIYDAFDLIVQRGRLTRTLPLDGAMLAVKGSRSQITSIVSDAFEVGAINSPGQTILSGSRETLGQIAALLDEHGVKSTFLVSPYAYHSRLLEPIMESFQQAAQFKCYAKPAHEWISTVTGAQIESELCGQYWADNFRQPVFFEQAIQAAVQTGCNTFIEIGPRPQLLALAAECVDEDQFLALPSMREEFDDWAILAESVSRLFVSGSNIDWDGFDAPYGRIARPLSQITADSDEAALSSEVFSRPSAATTAVTDDDIAIIGIGCRFPGGANSPDQFWQLIVNAESAIVPVPISRWNADEFYDPDPDTAGKMYLNKFGFLNVPIDEFDAQFFNISPRAAEWMDPQQRLVLEVAWEALENAGIDPQSLKGTSTGIFLGLHNCDFGQRIDSCNQLEIVGQFSGAGRVEGLTAGRLAYFLGTQGPAWMVDTACSSSMVAVHNARTSLLSGEIDSAIVGGVNVMLSPAYIVALCKAKLLSPTASCTPFDYKADGFVRGEGCGIVILKRLSDAQRDNDRVIAVIRSSSVNQDGASSGVTVPNGLAQERLIRKALQNAQLAPADIDLIEAHGTGTALGDPIEAHALARVFSKDRSPNNPLAITSVKGNIGHLESAAGIAGLIKAALAIQHECIPKQANFERINPLIALDEIPAIIPTDSRPWTSNNGHIRRAAVSSFGISGTNAHVILQEPPRLPATTNDTDRSRHLVALSAKSPAALEELLDSYAEYLAKNGTVSLGDLAFTANVGRMRHSHLAAINAESTSELLQKIKRAAYAKGSILPGQNESNIAYIFGNTSAVSRLRQIAGELYRTNKTFTDAFDWCTVAFEPHIREFINCDEQFSGEQLLQGEGLFQSGELERSVLSFAFEYALAELWKSFGIAPRVWIGHGQSRFVKSVMERTSTLDDACASVCTTTNDAGSAVEDSDSASQYGKSVASAQSAGCTIFLQGLSSPHVQENRQSSPPRENQIWLHCVNEQVPPWHTLLDCLAQLYVLGVSIDWAKYDSAYSRNKIELPTYPFQRQSHWPEALRSLIGSLASSSDKFPLLGEQTGTSKHEKRFENLLDLNNEAHKYLEDHGIFNTIIFPGAAYVELICEAVVQISGERAVVIEDMRLTETMSLSSEYVRHTEMTIAAPKEKTGRSKIVIRSRSDKNKANWQTHVHAHVCDNIPQAIEPPDFTGLLTQYKGKALKENFYEGVENIFYGPRFQTIDSLKYSKAEAYGELCLLPSTSNENYRCHPAILDGCFQVSVAAVHQFVGRTDQEDAAFIPVAIDRFTLYKAFPDAVSVFAKVVDEDEKTGRVKVDLTIFTSDGLEVLASVQGFTVQSVSTTRLRELLSQNIHQSDLFYHLEWRAHEHLAKLPDQQAAIPELDSESMFTSFQELESRDDVQLLDSQYDTLQQKLFTLCLRYIKQTFRNLGFRPAVGDTFKETGLLESTGIVASQRRLVSHCLAKLSEAGNLEATSDGWRVKNWDTSFDLVQEENEILRDYPHLADEIKLLLRCCHKLDKVWCGAEEPLSLLFGTNDVGAEAMYGQSIWSQRLHLLVRSAVENVVEQVPESKPLRILEVGAGTGSTTAAVLPILPPERTKYVFTDISDLFIAQAKETFVEFPFISYKRLDLETDFKLQGFAPEQFDIVIASNVLHSTKNIVETLENIRGLLTAGGVLIMREAIRERLNVDLIFGLLEGWWRFSDFDLRPRYPLLTGQNWRNVLADCGFGNLIHVDPKGTEWSGSDNYEMVLAAQLTEPTRVLEAATKSDQSSPLWLIFKDSGDVGESLSNCLKKTGQSVVAIDSDKERYEFDLDQVTSQIGTRQIAGAIYLWALDFDSSTKNDVDDIQRPICSGLLNILQGLHTRHPLKKLVIVTQGAQMLRGDAFVSLPQSTMVGFGRVITNEYPEVNSRLVDLDRNTEVNEAAWQLFQEIWSDDNEEEVVLRSGVRHVARLSTGARENSSREPLRHPPANYELVVAYPELQLRFENKQPRPLEADEVEIAVEASGINFRDVLASMGMVPGQVKSIGSEFSGVVTAVGSGVSTLQEGDLVFGLSESSFADSLIIPAKHVVKKPADVSHLVAAALPCVFSTAYASLCEIAALKKDETVLIHAGAGGVGVTAILIAKKLGARVFATASSARKHAYLKKLGVDQIFDSRSLAFAEQIMEATAGAGIDVVLNSLSGDFIPASLGVLNSHGRFIEIGKRAIWTTEQVRNAFPSVSYTVLALDRTMSENPLDCVKYLQTLCQWLANGEFKGFPVTAFPLERVQEAFDFMKQARHIGKVVLCTPNSIKNENQFRSDCTYVITGGLGGLGLVVTEHLLARGAKHVALINRSRPSEEASAKLEQWRNDGAFVNTFQADVADYAQLEAALNAIRQDMPSIRGIFHAACILSDGILLNQTWDSFRNVMLPKINGGWYLHELTHSDPLDHFVLFSSISSLFGNPGQVNYAAANAYLDSLAHYRHSMGLPALSINWGVWSSVGKAAEVIEQRGEFGLGIASMTPATALEAMSVVLREHTETQMAIIDIDWKRFFEITDMSRSWTSEIYSEHQKYLEQVSPGLDSQKFIFEELDRSDKKACFSFVRQLVERELRSILKWSDKEPLHGKQGFFDLGMDSLMSVELANKLRRGLAGAAAVSAPTIFDYPTIESLSDHLAEQIHTADSISLRSEIRPGKSGEQESIAIVGLGCRFPSGANDPDKFWDLLENGRDAISEIPASRWNVDDYYDANPDAPGKMYVRKGGFLDVEVDRFDEQLFAISPREAEWMDPQQRLLLEVVWEALEHAAINPHSLSKTPTAVYLGISSIEYYQQILRQVALDKLEGHLVTGSAIGMAAGRLAYTFGLQGPNMAIDTACSSSLVAVHNACASLLKGEADYAIAAGVHLMLDPLSWIAFCKMKALSSDGHCKTFDSKADGYAKGEGCGAVILRRLSDAERDGDNILAVIKSSAINHDGATSGLTVPNGIAQQVLIEDALQQADLSPDDIDVIEVHGTGTSIGDPIEVSSLTRVFGERHNNSKPIYLGAVKSYIGHLEAAAGIAGLIKTVLSMQHEAIPSNLHFDTLNPQISLEKMQAVIPVDLTPWPRKDNQPMRAGVSSFGFTGTNAHIIVEASTRKIGTNIEDEAGSDRPWHIMVLSAQSDGALTALVERYVAKLESFNDFDCSDVAYTANTGRAHLSSRLAVIAKDTKDLHDRLQRGQFMKRRISASDTRREVAFVFSSQGPTGAATADIYRTQPVFKDAIDSCDAVIAARVDYSIRQYLYNGNAESQTVEPTKQRLAIFSVQYALTQLWKSFGVIPHCSIGPELYASASAVSSGQQSLEEAIDALLASPEEPTESLLSRFENACADAARSGCTIFVNLSASVERPQIKAAEEIFCLPSIANEGDSWLVLVQSVATLYILGVQIDWRGFDKPYKRAKVHLPTYPFQRNRHWLSGLHTTPGSISVVEERPALASAQTLKTGQASLIYEVQWRAEEDQPANSPGSIDSSKFASIKNWIIFADRGGIGDSLAADLRTCGQPVSIIYQKTSQDDAVSSALYLAAEDKHGFATFLEKESKAKGPVGIVYLWSLDSDRQNNRNGIDAGQRVSLQGALHLIQALVSREARLSPMLWFVTKNAQCLPEQSTVAVHQTAINGLVKVARLEHPEIQCRSVDLDDEIDPSAAAKSLLVLLRRDSDELDVAVRLGKLYVPRLVNAADTSQVSEQKAVSTVDIRPDGTYVITGGAGGLGIELTEWLVKAGAKSIVHINRKPPHADTQRRVTELATLFEARIESYQADVSDRERLNEVLEAVRIEMPSVKGIFHLAGVVHPELLANSSWERFDQVCLSKIQGSWNLHELTKEDPLELFVLYSSVASLLGFVGLSSYASANAFLDGLAHYRRAIGLPAVSINWGPWADAGLISKQASSRDRLEPGLKRLSLAQALSACMQLISTRLGPQYGVIDLDVHEFLSGPRSNTKFFESLKQELEAEPFGLRRSFDRSAASDSSQPQLIEMLDRAIVSERLALLRAYVESEVKAVLKWAEDKPLAARAGFFELGMDSLMAMELSSRLQNAVGNHISLSAPTVFEHSTPERLTAFLAEKLNVVSEDNLKDRPSHFSNERESIAIVGMGCRFPGGANNPQQFWNILSNGTDTISAVPASRWQVDEYYDQDRTSPNKMYVKEGGFLNEDLRQFDAKFFGISPVEAEAMDPQQRLLLEVTWEALEHAGIAPSSLRETQTGVFIGTSANDFSQLMAQCRGADEDTNNLYATNTSSLAVGRLAYHFGTEGAAWAVDTACSSALVAVHNACTDILNGDSDCAIAGGVNVMLVPEPTIDVCKRNMLSADGRCKTFDTKADGYGRAEGCGILILKRLSVAQRDGDRILAVIRSSCVNQDGASSGLTAPNGAAQAKLLKRALNAAALAPADIDLIEAHGTGTALGDPIEFSAIKQVYAGQRSPENPLFLGSVKTNIGHAEAASGMAGLIKCILALQNQSIPAHLHLTELNPLIDLNSIPAVIPTSSVPWPHRASHVRRAGISSFGMSGTNAHVIIEEAPAVNASSSESINDRPLHLVALSARSEVALANSVKNLKQHLRESSDMSISDLAFTANSGRAHFEHRLAVCAKDLSELRDKLESGDILKGRPIFDRQQRPRVAFLFTGQGSLYAGMAESLYKHQPDFKANLDLVSREFVKLGNAHSLVHALYNDKKLLADPVYGQCAILAVEYSLLQLWKSFGIRPDLVIGHSLGEYGAAVASGVMPVETALSLVCTRARLFKTLPSHGSMLAVSSGLPALQAAIPELSKIDMAALNSPNQIVFSGEDDVLESLRATCEKRGIRAIPLPVTHAFHSRLVDPILKKMERESARFAYDIPQVTWVSTVTGMPVDNAGIDRTYWPQNMRSPVKYQQAIDYALSSGCDLFIEIGPEPHLVALGMDCASKDNLLWLPSLRRGRDDWSVLLDSLARSYINGAEVDWESFDRSYRRAVVSLPTYPFERQTYWPNALQVRKANSDARENVHPLLGSLSTSRD